MAVFRKEPRKEKKPEATPPPTPLTYKAVVTKGGDVIELPNPDRYWDGAASSDWKNHLVSKGVPGAAVDELWSLLYNESSIYGKGKPTPSGLAYFSSKTGAEDYSTKIVNEVEQREIDKVTIKNPKTLAEKISNYNTVLNRYGNNLNDLSKAKADLSAKYRNAATISNPKNINDAVSNFSLLIDEVRLTGVGNLSKQQIARINSAAKSVRDFDSKNLGAGAKSAIKNISDAQSFISKINNQAETVRVQQLRSKNLDADGKTNLGLDDKELQAAKNRYITEQDTYRRILSEANDSMPGLAESLTRIGVTDVVSGLGTQDKRVGEVDTGLSGLGANKYFGQSSLVGKLNNQVSDDQIRADLSTTRRTQAESVYKLGNATLVDLNSQLSQANQFLSNLSATDPRRKATQDKITSLTKDIADVTADTNAAKAIFDNPGTIDAKTISSFRETLRLPEERALDQIGQIDPGMLSTAKGLSEQFRSIATSPLGPTQDTRTEAMRGMIEDEAMNQLRLGSTLDESVRREVQQASRGAQAARGNIFGVAPAVEEAMQTGMMGEQRKAQRYGAAAAFLASGQSRGDQAARNTALRQSLDLTRLGAANEFMSGGANPYNLANQRVANQNANFLNYINANTAATGGFANTANQVNPFQFVNPNAGLEGARTSAMTYGNLLDFTSRNYSAYAGAQAQVASANSLPNYISAFTNLVPSFSF